MPNARLPPHVQQSLAYPHLPTMLVSNPSEAQHSELIMEAMRRYFFVDLFRPLGGPVAYPILRIRQAVLKDVRPARKRPARCILANEAIMRVSRAGRE